MEVGEERMEQGFGPGLSELGVCGDRAGRSPAETVSGLEGSSWELRPGELNRKHLHACLPSFPL